MTTYTFTSAPDVATDTAFRKWVGGVDAAFLANGWLRSADTGQMDPATISAVTSTGTATSGYSIYYLNDSLHASAPIYVRLDFGRATSTTTFNHPSVGLTVGRGTDGAGTITGVLYARVFNNTSSSTTSTGTTTEYPSYASSDGHGICLSMWPSFVAAGSSATFFLAIERSRDALGVSTGSGLAIIFGGPSISNGNGVVVIGYYGVRGAVQCAQAGSLGNVLPYQINGLPSGAGQVNGNLSSDGVTAPILPIPFMAPGIPPWVSTLLVGVHPGDAASTSVILAGSINGSRHVYRAWTNMDGASGLIVLSGATAATAGSTTCRPAILWE